MKKKFVAYFENMENFHFNKDVGMVPHFFSEKFDLDLEYVSALDTGLDFFRGHKVTKIKKSFNKYNFYFYLYLFKNRGKIDYLMTFHFMTNSFVLAFIYKIFNPKGKMYLKMDLVGGWKLEKNNSSIRLSIKTFRKKLTYSLSRYVDLFSVERKELFDLFSNSKNLVVNIKNKITRIQNGVPSDFLPELKFEDKQNIIITVARLGTYQKNTEFLLEGLANLDLKNWKVILIGPIEKHFEKKIEDFYKSYPNDKTKIEFIGNIEDPKLLSSYFAKSKIFLLTSREESCALVLAEARYTGNYIITTNIGGAKDNIIDSNYGVIINSPLELSEELQKVINNEEEIKDKLKVIIKNRNAVTWESIIFNNKDLETFFI
ncbi:MAG: glycosyltransferase family 4 protein [Fusobacteriaceae bacterium]